MFTRESMSNNSKRGVIVVPGYSASPHKNIGDYIQSLAALQFIPSGYMPMFLDRDCLDSVESDTPIKAIMNGWWIGHPTHFPPSKAIEPLYISFHLTPKVESAFFSEETIDHLKKHQPIGCRDENTVKLMEKHGIKAYFSGCLTLTLGLTYKNSSNSDSPIYIVDPYVGKIISRDIKSSLLIFTQSMYVTIVKNRTVRKIAYQIGQTLNNKRSRYSLLLYSAKLYSTYSTSFSDELLKSAIYQEHLISKSAFPTNEERLKISQDLLYKYSKAKFVITSRIHCGLPCLGMGTPVLLVVSSSMIQSGRMGKLMDFFKKGFIVKGKCTLNTNDFPETKIITTSESIMNYDRHISFAHQMIDLCHNFMNH